MSSRRAPVTEVLFFLGALFAAPAAIAAPQLEVQEIAATGSMPKGVTLSPDGTRLFVTNFGQANGKNLSIYDSATLAPIADVDVPGIVVESIFNADGSLLYASNFPRDSVQIIDTKTRRVTREIQVGLHPKILVLSKDGKTLFAANWNGNSVSEIDLARGVTVRTHQAGVHPRGMALTSAGSLYVANFDGATIDVFHGPSFAENYTLAVCPIPRHLVLAPDEKTMFLSCYHDSQLWALDLTGISERANHIVPIGKLPKSIDVSRDGKYVYSADYGPSNSVSIVDTADWSASTYTVPGMDRGSGIAVLPGGRRAAVTGWCDDHVYIVGIQGSGGHPAETLAKIGHMPHGHCTAPEAQ
ncbi:MAG TPA: YncE family protein [Polyangiaceae bacterium]|jgi:YVTN family beta-propeller protein|nr:YncE family protein [Polyangiaceae bacterium]